jgi:ankyrin repeat protein
MRINKPVKVTIVDLAKSARKYDGRLVRIDALLSLSWEGDNFLSAPNPTSMPPNGQNYVWLYCKPEYRQQVFGPVMSAGHGSVYGSFTGYFHFVEKPHVINGTFYPGQLQFEAVRALIRHPKRLSLAEAIRDGNLEEARKLVRSGVRINVWNEHRSLPLIEAVRTGHTDFAEELLAEGADPNVAGSEGDTALGQAAWYCNLTIAKELLNRGARVNASDVNGQTALMSAAQTCPDGQMVKLLLDAGADPNQKTPGNFTPLMSAEGNPVNTAELLKDGADPTVQNRYGWTAESQNCERGGKGYAQACNLIREALENSAEHPPK